MLCRPSHLSSAPSKAALIPPRAASAPSRSARPSNAATLIAAVMDANGGRNGRIFEGENQLCERCQAGGIVKLMSDVHHRTPLSEGGADDESNYEALCHECRSKETRGYPRNQ
jgi:5-methylcytosine-specific restriction endonuclease McrA